MRKAVAALPIAPQVLLIDGLPVPQLADCEHKAIVRGDALSISIATASVVAKVTRDRLMCIYATTYPEYGFELHKGYASEQHLLALRTHGPCPIHRRSFAPVAALLQPVLL
jgi:ribonuclease HII